MAPEPRRPRLTPEQIAAKRAQWAAMRETQRQAAAAAQLDRETRILVAIQDGPPRRIRGLAEHLSLDLHLVRIVVRELRDAGQAALDPVTLGWVAPRVQPPVSS